MRKALSRAAAAKNGGGECAARKNGRWDEKPGPENGSREIGFRSAEHGGGDSVFALVFHSLQLLHVDHRGRYVLVVQELLRFFQTAAVQEVQCCRRVPEAVGRVALVVDAAFDHVWTFNLRAEPASCGGGER